MSPASQASPGPGTDTSFTLFSVAFGRNPATRQPVAAAPGTLTAAAAPVELEAAVVLAELEPHARDGATASTAPAATASTRRKAANEMNAG